LPGYKIVIVPVTEGKDWRREQKEILLSYRISYTFQKLFI